jgi:lipopolysaccharide export system permease protein
VDGYRYQGLPGTLDFTIHRYEKNAVRLEERGFAPLRRSHWAIPSSQLWQSKQPTEQAELQWRISMPLSTVLLAVLAVLLSRTTPRQGRFAKLFIAILVFVAYYNSLGVSMSWMERGVIPATIGLWWVHALLLILILILALRHWGWSWLWQRWLLMVKPS